MVFARIIGNRSTSSRNMAANTSFSLLSAISALMFSYNYLSNHLGNHPPYVLPVLCLSFSQLFEVKHPFCNGFPLHDFSAKAASVLIFMERLFGCVASFWKSTCSFRYPVLNMISPVSHTTARQMDQILGKEKTGWEKVLKLISLWNQSMISMARVGISKMNLRAVRSSSTQHFREHMCVCNKMLF